MKWIAIHPLPVDCSTEHPLQNVQAVVDRLCRNFLFDNLRPEFFNQTCIDRSQFEISKERTNPVLNVDQIPSLRSNFDGSEIIGNILVDQFFHSIHFFASALVPKPDFEVTRLLPNQTSARQLPRNLKTLIRYSFPATESLHLLETRVVHVCACEAFHTAAPTCTRYVSCTDVLVGLAVGPSLSDCQRAVPP